MNTLLNTIRDNAQLWGPSLLGAVVILIGFIILAKIVKRIIIHSALRLKLDKDIASLFSPWFCRERYPFQPFTELDSEGTKILIPDSKLSTDAITVCRRLVYRIKHESEIYFFNNVLRYRSLPAGYCTSLEKRLIDAPCSIQG